MRKSIIFTGILLTFLGSNMAILGIAYAEVTWSRTYGSWDNEVANWISETSDGGYILIGYSITWGEHNAPNVLLIKTDAIGNEIWMNVFYMD